jgi:MFS family permease
MSCIDLKIRDKFNGAASLRGWVTVFMLAILLVLSLLDRQILVLLIGPLKAQFQLSDVQIGLLLGTAFAITYAFLGIPAGRIADRGNRKILIIAGVTLWCLCTVASGFATTFAVLILFRIGLAAGEAVLTPAAHSMIGDRFPPEKRGLAASIYIAAAFVGGPLAYSGGALIIGSMDSLIVSAGLPLQTWQAVLFAVGAQGLLLCLIFALVVREPVRSSVGSADAPSSSRDVLNQLLSRKKLYSGLFFGATLVSAASSAVIVWGVEIFKRDFGWTAVQAGSAFGPVVLVAGLTGSMLAPWIARQLKKRDRLDAVVVVSIGFSIVSLVALGVGTTQSDSALRLVLDCLGLTGAVGGCTNIASAMQEVAPQKMRGTFIALLYMLFTLIGYGVAPVAVPWAAKLLGSSSGSLSQGLAIVCVAVNGLGLLLFWWVRDAYQREARAGFPTVGTPTAEINAMKEV